MLRYERVEPKISSKHRQVRCGLIEVGSEDNVFDSGGIGLVYDLTGDEVMNNVIGCC